jgi:hypothetical protein
VMLCSLMIAPDLSAQSKRRRKLTHAELAEINASLRESSEELYAPGGSGRMARTGEEEGFGQHDESDNIDLPEKDGEKDGEKVEKDKNEENAAEEPQVAAEEDGIPLEVKVYAKDCNSESDYFLTDHIPSSISISGTVTDQYGDPVPGATVALIEKKKETQTNKNGRYVINASHGGEKPYSTTVNFIVIRKLIGLKAKLTERSIITANGKTAEVTLQISHDKGPLKNEEIDISDTQGFEKNGKKIRYVQNRNSNSKRLTTDDSGSVSFTLNNPDSVKYLGPGVSSESAFPVTGFLKFRVISAETEATALYSAKNPFPRILNVTAPKYLSAETWQVTPSEVTVEDNDSTDFLITLSGLGWFKNKGDRMSAENKGHPKLMFSKFSGRNFYYHYRPAVRSFDITKEPEVAKILGETAGKISLSVLTNLGANKMLDANRLKTQKFVLKVNPGTKLKNGGRIFAGLGSDIDTATEQLMIIKTLIPVSKTAANTLDAASHLSNIGNLAATTYVGADNIKGLADGEFTEKNVVTTTDNAIGLIDTVVGFAGDAVSMKAKIALEALKASWELDKAAYTISKGYYDLADSYEELVHENVTITIEDETGRKVDLARPYNVLVLRLGDGK